MIGSRPSIEALGQALAWSHWGSAETAVRRCQTRSRQNVTVGTAAARRAGSVPGTNSWCR